MKNKPVKCSVCNGVIKQIKEDDFDYMVTGKLYFEYKEIQYVMDEFCFDCSRYIIKFLIRKRKEWVTADWAFPNIED